MFSFWGGEGPEGSPKTYVKDSPLAGKGLFAARDISAGEILDKFVGRVISRKEALQMLAAGKGTHLITLVTGHEYLDCSDVPLDAATRGEGASFANSTLETRLVPNARVKKVRRNELQYDLVLQATRPIAKDEEILFAYNWR